MNNSWKTFKCTYSNSFKQIFSPFILIEIFCVIRRQRVFYFCLKYVCLYLALEIWYIDKPPIIAKRYLPRVFPPMTTTRSFALVVFFPSRFLMSHVFSTHIHTSAIIYYYFHVFNISKPLIYHLFSFSGERPCWEHRPTARGLQRGAGHPHLRPYSLHLRPSNNARYATIVFCSEVRDRISLNHCPTSYYNS